MELKPGYKQTEVGVIPEDWTAVTLEAVTTHIGDGLHGTPVYTRNADYYFINGNNLSHGKIIITPDTQTVDQKEFAQHRKPLSNRSILMSINGTIGNLGLFQDQSLVLGKSAAYLNVRTDVSKLYVYHVLQSSCVRQQFFDGLTGSTIGNLGLSAIRSTYIPLPLSDSEQASVAKALGDADDLLYSLDQLLIKKRSIKQAAMQELLTGKRRLPGFEGEWEVKRLGEIGSTFGGLTGKAKSDFGNGDAHYVTFMNVMMNVEVNCECFERVRVASNESQNRVLRGDLLFNGSSETPDEVAMCSLLTKDVSDLYLNSFCFGYRLRADAPVSGLFLAYLIRSDVGREVVKSLAQGSTRYNLSKSALLDAAIQLPNIGEQTAIATVLSDMDDELASLDARLGKARELKQGMMQQLLTGKIRLT